MQKKLSAIRTEYVEFNYEYTDEELTEECMIHISGQFNDWGFEEMTKLSKGKYQYKTMVQGGQIYNFYLFRNGEIFVDKN